MDQGDLNEALWQIVARFDGPETPTHHRRDAPPFDISRQNQHDSKAEFCEEKDAVLTAIENCKSICFCLMPAYLDGHERQDLSQSIGEWVDTHSGPSTWSRHLGCAIGLVRKNAADVSLSLSAVVILSDLHDALLTRKQDLENQEALFWSGGGRAPNHYARAIALRLAKHIARKTGRKPTFGTSRDGGHPSTDYGRALEEVFNLLGIKARPKRPAKWALEQLTEEDLVPEQPVGVLGAALAALYPVSSGDWRSQLVAAMMKGREP